MILRMVLTTALCAALAVPGAAVAQSSDAAAAIARVEELGDQMAYVPVCRRHGYIDSEPGAMEGFRRAVGAAVAAGASDADVKKAMAAGGERGLKRIDTGMAGAMNATEPEALKAALRVWVEETDERCARMAAAPGDIAQIVAPADFDRAAGRLAAMDYYLEPAGLAGWQTPRIAAIGQLAYSLGACRSRLGARKTQAILAPFVGKTKAGDITAPRDQRYYVERYEAGVAIGREAKMSKEDCAIPAGMAPLP